MTSKTRLFTIAALVVAFAAIQFLSADSVQRASSQTPGNKILARELAFELGQAKRTKTQLPLSSGVMYAVLQASGELAKRADAVGDGKEKQHPGGAGPLGCSNTYTGGGTGAARNIRVNQDCSLRRQAEEVIVFNPTNPNNLIAGQNDSRIGFNHCGYDWSFDGGKTWGDMLPPFWQFQMLDGHTADACSDPTATFDSQGNAYAAGLLFDVAFDASAFVVAKSNAGLGGSFYHTPDSAQSFQTYRDLPLGVIANDNDPCIFNDKEYIVADATASSPKANNVYASWTRFSCTDSPIYFSQSTDGGATWSPGVEISGSNGAICTFGGPDCDQDQGSDPIVGADGTIYVIFGNANKPDPGINQVLFVKCPAGADCSSSANWTTPVKINDLIGTHPIGDPGNVGGCPVGRQCLPPNGYRVPEFTSMSLSVDNNSTLYAVWSDFRNGDDPGSTCGPLLNWSDATPPCDNDVFYSYSTDGGATWSTEFTFAAPGSAQWEPWSDVTDDGATLYVAYYDRKYGDCETTGCNDITLAKVNKPASASPKVKYSRMTTSSMPNLVPSNNPLQAGFLGDYIWVSVSPDGRPNIVWADTRGLGGTVEEDVYYATYP